MVLESPTTHSQRAMIPGPHLPMALGASISAVSPIVLQAYTGCFTNQFDSATVLIGRMNCQLFLRDQRSRCTFTLKFLDETSCEVNGLRYFTAGTLQPYDDGVDIASLPEKEQERRGEVSRCDFLVGFVMHVDQVVDIYWSRGEDLEPHPGRRPGLPVPLPHRYRYSRNVRLCNFLSLPVEVREIIYEYVLTTGTKDVRLLRTNGRFFVTATKSPRRTRPGYDFRIAKRLSRLQFVSKAIMEETRGLELKHNRLKSSIETFHLLQAAYKSHSQNQSIGSVSILNSIKYDWLNHVRKVKLTGKFHIDECPDENVLHGILGFAATHKNALGSVDIDILNMQSRLQGFTTRTYLIKEAARWTTRPSFVAPQTKKYFQQWRRGRTRTFVDNDRVRYFPSDEWNEQHVRKLVKGGSGDYRKELLLLHNGSRDSLVLFIKDIYMNGI